MYYRKRKYASYLRMLFNKLSRVKNVASNTIINTIGCSFFHILIYLHFAYFVQYVVRQKLLDTVHLIKQDRLKLKK